MGCHKDLPVVVEDKSPIIISITPESFIEKDIVTLNGKNFGAEMYDSQVLFGNIPAQNYIFWSDTLITLVAPAISEDGKVRISTMNGTSQGFSYSIDKCPRIFSAGNGRAFSEETIEITGINFGHSEGFVSFNGKKAKKIKEWDETKIKVEVPEEASSGMLYVNNGGKLSKGFYFTVAKVSDPFINMISPAISAVDFEIKLFGRNFGDSQNSSYIDFNGIIAENYTLWTKDSIRVIVPKGAATGLLRVFVGMQSSNTIKVTINKYGPAPEISSVSSTSFQIGEIITITGKNFGLAKFDEANVLFNGFPAIEYPTWESSTILVKVPEGIQSGKLLVKIGDEVSNPIDYNIIK